MLFYQQASNRKPVLSGCAKTLRMLTAVLGLSGISFAAAAHVNYIDLSNPAISPGGVNGSTFSNFGWYAGTTPTLGDTHELAGGDFFKFHLDQAATVSITFSEDANAGLLDPAFSLYSGLLPDDGHDDAPFDPLNPAHLVTTPFPHAVKDPSPVDNGVSTDAYGRVSPFRDTANITYVGQFDALHTWSLANESGDWSVIQYLTHVDPTGGNSVSLLNFALQAGDYTIAASGGRACDPATGCVESQFLPQTGLAGTISLTTTSAVPLPASVWLMFTALTGLGAVARRKA